MVLKLNEKKPKQKWLNKITDFGRVHFPDLLSKSCYNFLLLLLLRLYDPFKFNLCLPILF